MSSLHVRLDAPQLAELDRRRMALPIPPSRNAYASYLLGLALEVKPAVHVPMTSRGVPLQPPPTMPAKGPWSQAQDEARVAVGARLRVARVALGWTQRRLAEELGVADTTIGRIEAGKLELVGRPLAWVEEQERASTNPTAPRT